MKKEIEHRLNLIVILKETELTQREIEVLRYRYINGMTFKSIGDMLGLTRKRIRQIQEKAIEKLRVLEKLIKNL